MASAYTNLSASSESDDFDEFVGPAGMETDGEVFAAITGYTFEPRRQSRGSIIVREPLPTDIVIRVGNRIWCVHVIDVKPWIYALNYVSG